MKNDSGMTVTGDRVLIRPFKIEETSPSGLVIPEMVKDREQVAAQYGVLVGIGPGAEDAPELDGIDVGDTVIFPKYQSAEFKFDEERYWIMKVTSILGKTERLPDFFIRGAESSLSVFGSNSPIAS